AQEEWTSQPPQALVCATSPALHGAGLALMRRLRQEGLRVELDLRNRSPRANLDYALKRGTAHLIIVDGTPAAPQYHLAHVSAPKQSIPMTDMQELAAALRRAGPPSGAKEGSYG
ncbi:MAG: His/Gly/Thr/Pro-type tRNA ligase C-terminal domain-containing protein, partial [Anaerolineae bacterium]